MFPFFNAVHRLGSALPAIDTVALYQIRDDQELHRPRGIATDWYAKTLEIVLAHHNQGHHQGPEASKLFATDFREEICFEEVVTVAVDVIAPHFYTIPAANAFRSASFLNLGLGPRSLPSAGVATLLLRTNDRVITNEPELITALKDFLGKHKYELRTMKLDKVLPFKYQVDMYSSTSLLVSFHGAQLTNVVCMVSGSVVVEIFNCHHFSDTYMRYALEAGIKYFSTRDTKPGCAVIDHKHGKSYGNMNRDVHFQELEPALMEAMDYLPSVLH